MATANQTSELSDGAPNFLEDMDVSEKLFFSHVSDGNDTADDHGGRSASSITYVDDDGDDASGQEENIDFLGIVIFVVCGHFFIKWFFTIFSCFERCVIPRESPVRSLKFLYLLFSNLVLYSCLFISFGTLQADKIGYISANLFVSIGCLCAVEAIVVYCKVLEYGQLLSMATTTTAAAAAAAAAGGQDEESSAPPLPRSSRSENDFPPTYEEVMAHKAREEEREREQQQGEAAATLAAAEAAESVRGGGQDVVRLQQSSLNSASLLR